MDTLPLAFLSTVAVGGVAYVFLYPLLSGERQAEKRRESIARSEKTPRNARQQQKSRREAIENTLKQLEERQKQTKLTLATRIQQAGLTWSKRQFLIVSAVLGLAFLLFGAAIGAGLPVQI